jgi:hypothetical protein
MHIEIAQIVLGTADDKTTQGERQLLIAIIRQALRDLTDAKHRAGARAFFKSEGFEYFCHCLGLNAVAIREKVL